MIEILRYIHWLRMANIISCSNWTILKRRSIYFFDRTVLRRTIMYCFYWNITRNWLSFIFFHICRNTACCPDPNRSYFLLNHSFNSNFLWRRMYNDFLCYNFFDYFLFRITYFGDRNLDSLSNFFKFRRSRNLNFSFNNFLNDPPFRWPVLTTFSTFLSSYST